jgi:NADH:ubiquinone oxidoreductase subunit 2 (subunit N)
MPFSLASRRARGESVTRLLLHALWRSIALILLGIFLRSLERPQTYWTFEDTLTQIGLGYTVLFLLAFAGIPLTSGFAGKFAVFKAAAEGGAVPLVVVGVIASAIAAFFYIRVIVLMFFSEPRPEGPTVAVPSPLTMTAIAVGVAVTLVLGVAPQYFLDLANQAGVFVR